jgi:c-di-GMP-binding flagellar brake protein YcgR
LVLQKDLHISMKIEVAREDEGTYYISSIQDIKKGVILIAIPYLAGEPLNLQSGQKVNIKFSGANEAYSFATIVQGMVNDTIPLYILAVPQHLERVQRRSYVRVPANLEINLKKTLNDDEMKFDSAEQDVIVVRSLNISAGGLKFICDQRHPLNTAFGLNFSLPGEGRNIQISATANVVRREELDRDGKRRYAVSLAFLEINSYQQDEIVSYIFKRMVELGRMRVAGKRRIK